MKINSITIKNFKKFRNETVQFRKGLNIIIGPNEAGKSTIAEALIICLYGDPKTRSQAFLSNAISWKEEGLIEQRPIFELEFKANDKHYYLYKNFEKKEALLKSMDGKEEYTTIKSVQKFIGELVGISTQEVYEATGYIRQEDIANIRKSNDLLSAVQNAASNVDNNNDVHKTLKEINTEISSLQRGISGMAKTPGPIKQYTDARKKIVEEMGHLKSVWQEVLGNKDRKESIKDQIVNIEDRVKILEKLLSNYAKYKEAKNLIDTLEKELQEITEDISEIEDLGSQITQIEIKQKKYESLENEDLDELLLKFKQIDNEVALKKETIQTLDKEIQEISFESALKNKIKYYYIVVAIFVGSFLFSVITTNYYAFIGGSILTILAFVYFLYDKYLGNIPSTYRELKIRQKELQSIIKTDETKIEKMLSEYNLETKDEFLMVRNDISSARQEKEKIGARVSGILRGKEISHLKDHRNQLLIKKEGIIVNRMSDEIVNSQIKPEEYIKKTENLKGLYEEYEKLKKELIVIETKLDNEEIGHDVVEQKELDLEEIDRELAYHNHRLNILETTKEFLEKAIEDTSGLVSTILRTDIQKYFPSLTSNKYSEVKIDKDLNINVLSKKHNKWVEPKGKLSIGAVDQIHFLIRLSFFKLISSDNRPVLILDDPFVSFDEKRLIVAMDILNKEGEEGQIILLTHNERYQDYGYTINLY